MDFHSFKKSMSMVLWHTALINSRTLLKGATEIHTLKPTGFTYLYKSHELRSLRYSANSAHFFSDFQCS